MVVNNNGPLGVLTQLSGLTDSEISLSFQTGEIESESDSEYTEDTEKQENAASIINRRKSTLKDNITTTVKYKVKIGSSGLSEAVGDLGLPTDMTLFEGGLASVEQGLYRDIDGQYKYRKSSVDNVVERQKQWETPFVR